MTSLPPAPDDPLSVTCRSSSLEIDPPEGHPVYTHRWPPPSAVRDRCRYYIKNDVDVSPRRQRHSIFNRRRDIAGNGFERQRSCVPSPSRAPENARAERAFRVVPGLPPSPSSAPELSDRRPRSRFMAGYNRESGYTLEHSGETQHFILSYFIFLSYRCLPFCYESAAVH